MKRQTAIFFYVLSAYVVLQFAWWGYHLIELSKTAQAGNRRIFMIIGEGAVFFLILIAGLWQIRRSIKKQLDLSKSQNNFMLSVTHELKTPLAGNKLYLQTLLKRKLSEEKQQEILHKAIEENIRLETMIDNVLYATRIDNKKFQLHKEKFYLYPILDQLKNRYNKVNENVEIQIECKENIELFADPFLIEIVLNNLMENALKYGDKQKIQLFASSQNNNIFFGVKNTGKAIKKSNHTKVFEKFYRIQDENTRSEKGTGLGLYIINQIVQMHSGAITINSTTDFASEFIISIQAPSN